MRHTLPRRSPISYCRPRLENLEDRTLLDVNPIVLENQRPGNPSSEWNVVGDGSPNIQGFATDISVDQGQTVQFKVKTDATDYRLDIYRMGYYGGLGARKVATVQPSWLGPQPEPIRDTSTGLVDCGNWAVSASWAVPADATSGIYFAKLVREDGTAGASHVVFIVRDDDGRSDLLFQTSDANWQAYNNWGGTSLYTSDIATLPGRGYKVSYNRPFQNRGPAALAGGKNWVFHAEYPMVMWLESNGYNVSYFTNVDADRRGAEIREHKAFLSVGHDEYWSGGQRANVEAARDAGVNLAFFSGNEVYWKTRWETSLDGTGTPYRTLVCYKETHANARIDPTGIWTGTWRDPRFSPPADGGRPENALTGTLFGAQSPDDHMWVNADEGDLRFWRNTNIAALEPGQSSPLTYGSITYEFDQDADNGFRPAGLFQLASAKIFVQQKLLDHGSTFGPGDIVHSSTMYRTGGATPALVFGAGTIGWSWGLYGEHDYGPSVPDLRMRQATVNLFADMNVQPGSLQPGLVAATASSDTTPPTAALTAPPNGGTVQAGAAVVITGTAADAGGAVAGVEVSTDGVTWRRANGRSSWSYVWAPTATGGAVLRARAVDDSGNVGPAGSITVTVLSDASSAPRLSDIAASALTATGATVSWLTEEASSSRVEYGTAPAALTQSVSNATAVTAHSLALTGLAANTRYYYRAVSTDEFNNTATSATLSFTTPAYRDTAPADFASGSTGGTTYLTGAGGVTLAPAAGTEFSGAALDPGWTSAGSAVVANGAVSLENANVRSAGTFGPGRSAEFDVTFNGGVQYVGFLEDNNTTPYAAVVSLGNGEVYARTKLTPSALHTDTRLPAAYWRTPHRFRIDWLADRIDFWADGNVLLASHPVTISAPLRALATDTTADGVRFDVSSIRVTPYAGSGSYTSRVFDAGQSTNWGPVSWDAAVPAGTGLSLLVRTGNTPAPDGSWTAFAPIAQGGAPSGAGRYLQYRADLSTSAPGRTPVLQEVRLSHGGTVVTAPEIEVADGGTNLADGGSVSFGSTAVGTAVSKTFTVRNAGTATLTLGSAISVPSGFTVTAGFASTSLAPGASTTFTVRLDAAAAGSYSGPLSFTNGDADESPFDLTLSGTVTTGSPPPGAVQVIDDGAAGYSTGGNWDRYVGTGHAGDFSYSPTGTGADVATWTFAVTPGMYRVSASWVARPNRAPDAPYTILDGTTALATFRANQRLDPNDFTDAGTAWEDLGTFTVNGNTLVVRLSDAASGEYVIADGVRIERVSAPPPPPAVQVIDDGAAGYSTSGSWQSYVGTGHAGDFSYTQSGSGADLATWLFTVAPGQYRVSATWVARPNRASDAPYTILDGATALGTFRADQRLDPNDFTDAGSVWENLGTFTISGSSLAVRLSDAASGEYVIADAVRIERIG